MAELFQIGNQVIHDHQLPTLLRRYQLIPQLLRGIIIDQAIANITCSEEERQAALEKLAASHQLTTPEAFAAWLSAQNLTREQVEELAIQPVRLEKFKTAAFNSKVETYFFSRKSSLDQVVYSLIRTQDPGLAHEIYFRISEGEQSFSDVAREHSQGPEARTGGLLGPVPLSQPHPAIAKLLSISQPGQLWTPRPLAEWYVIIRLEKLIRATLDDSMRRRLIDELFETWLQEQTQQIKILSPVPVSP